MTPLLEAVNAAKHYSVKSLFGSKGTVKALSGVSFELNAGETLGIVGESGCGKTTLAKCLMQIEPLTTGDFKLRGKPFRDLPAKELRQKLQMIFQDPYSSLNPRKKAWAIVAEPLLINTDLTAKECRERAIAMMLKVGLRPEYANRYPHMFSGGQRQRLGIARALVLKPEILLCDEPVSALDVSIQAQILNLLNDLQREMNLSYLFISHDLSVVKHIADRVMVIYLGKVVEYGSRDEIFSNPRHPYTQSLLGSTPSMSFGDQKTKRSVLRGELPSPLRPPPGCSFHKRCPIATARCSQETPELRKVGDTLTACHFV